jgi:clostripain
MDMGELNMGDPAVLQDFVEWATTNYPAQHYALSIWNHGDGWRKNREMMDSLRAVRAQSRSGEQETLMKAVASDDTDGDILYMREVEDALNNARSSLESKGATNVKIDVIGFDACLMGMVEVAYAIRNSTSYMVASEETEPGDGWPYNTILSDLVNNPGMTPEALAKNIVVRYGNSYPNTSVTQAAYDISKLENVAQKIDNFTTKATTNWAG